MQRRSLLAASLTWVAAQAATARQVRPGETPLRLGVDRSLVESGLARSLQRAFGIATGLAVEVVAGPAAAVLEAVRDGEVDAALVNVPAAEADLERQGLVHDRQAVASGEFILVGPASVLDTPTVPWPHAAHALTALRDRATTVPGSVVFLSAGDGSGLHLAEQNLWRRAGVAPAEPWYVSAGSGNKLTAALGAKATGTQNPGGLVARARELQAFALVERGAWLAHGGAPLVPLAPGAARLDEPVHVMRAFRASHPAGKMFVGWIAGARGRGVVARQRGYRAPDRAPNRAPALIPRTP